MQTRLVSVRYDAAQGAFEARVDVESDGPAPSAISAGSRRPNPPPRDWIEEALTRHALRQSDSGRPQARLH